MINSSVKTLEFLSLFGRIILTASLISSNVTFSSPPKETVWKSKRFKAPSNSLTFLENVSAKNNNPFSS